MYYRLRFALSDEELKMEKALSQLSRTSESRRKD